MPNDPMRWENGKDLADRILPLLAETSPGFVSGEEIAGRMGVSRVAVWKAIQRLKGHGLAIQASRKGYCLEGRPDLLWPSYLAWLLGERFPNLSIVYRETIDSTSTLAKRLAQEGAGAGTLVIADQQGRGRGRLSRSWFSRPGKSLLFSILLRPQVAPERLPSLSLVTALALARSLEKQNLRPMLKWPNDLLLGGKKVAGILLESSMEPDQIEWVVVGVGINVNYSIEDWSQELAPRSTSLQEVTGKSLNRAELLRGFLEEFSRHIDQWTTAGSFAAQKGAYLERMAWLDRVVDIRSGKECKRGVAIGVGDGGDLLLQVGGEIERIRWGEGSLVIDRNNPIC
ncbi:MAG TPA: biotin--[acetyl-CoA-carboxylase] ligase [Atribacteraceae bacterium]|nr:biotin--[acetyl-CoA-carboxylase] ligase [Atribacteraceae bacterium]